MVLDSVKAALEGLNLSQTLINPKSVILLSSGLQNISAHNTRSEVEALANRLGIPVNTVMVRSEEIPHVTEAIKGLAQNTKGCFCIITKPTTSMIIFPFSRLSTAICFFHIVLLPVRQQRTIELSLAGLDKSPIGVRNYQVAPGAPAIDITEPVTGSLILRKTTDNSIILTKWSLPRLGCSKGHLGRWLPDRRITRRNLSWMESRLHSGQPWRRDHLSMGFEEIPNVGDNLAQLKVKIEDEIRYGYFYRSSELYGSAGYPSACLGSKRAEHC